MSGIGILAFLALLASSPDHDQCAPIPGSRALLSDPSVKRIVVGEMHGTKETPAAFADLVCLAASSAQSVVVALEHPTTEQAAFDRFMSSDGGSDAVQDLTTAHEWHSKLQDGRTSAARLALFQWLREMVAQKRIARVTAIMPTEPLSDSDYEKVMAANVLNAGHSNELVLVLVGNVHAMLTPWSNVGASYLPMAANLPRGSTKTLNAKGNGGSAWVCMTTCGSHELSAGTMSHERGITESDGKPYDAIFYLGTPTTASPPAADN